MTNLRFNFKIDLINVDYIDFSFAEDYQDLEDNPFLTKHFPDQGEYQKETIVLSLTEEEEALFPDKYYVLAKIHFIDSGIIKAHACKMKQASVASISIGAAEQNIDLYMNEIDMGGYYNKEEIDEFLENKQDTLTAGTNIVIDENNTISAIGDISIDYDNAVNKPQINNVTLLGNKSLDELGIQPKINLDNIPIKNKEKGNSIQLNDSSNRTIDSINVIGKSTQVTTKGYQLCNTNKENRIYKSGTWNENKVEINKGSIFNFPEGSVFDFVNSRIGAFKIPYNFIAGETYTLTVKSNNNKSMGMYFETYLPNAISADDRLEVLANGCNYSITFEAQENIIYALNPRTANTTEGGPSAESTTLTVMLEKGVETHEWEEYSNEISSPNIAFPQPIVDTTLEEIIITNGRDTQLAVLTKTLRGIPVSSGGNYTDNNGQQWICDTIERYKDGSGKYIQRVAKVVFDGSEHWADYSRTVVYMNIRTIISDTPTIIDSVTLAETSFFTFSNNVKSYATLVDADDNSYMIKSSRIYFSPTVNGQRLNATQLKEYLSSNNAELECCLETPIEIPLTSEELAELELDTYYPSTTITTNTDVVVEYICDTKNYIDKKFNAIQNAIISLGGNV